VAQCVQARQVVGQRAQLVAGQVEHRQRVGKIEDLARKRVEMAVAQIQMGGSGQAAGTQVGQGCQDIFHRLRIVPGVSLYCPAPLFAPCRHARCVTIDS
jgi:hypothetical protein